MWVRQKAGALDITNCAFSVLLSMAFVYPLVMTLAMSLSDSVKLGCDPIGLWPVGYSLNAYGVLLSDITMPRSSVCIPSFRSTSPRGPWWVSSRREEGL